MRYKDNELAEMIQVWEKNGYLSAVASYRLIDYWKKVDNYLFFQGKFDLKEN